MKIVKTRRLGTPTDPLVEFSDALEFESCSMVPEGRFSIDYNGIPVDFYFDYRSSDTTVVCFHGAIQSTVSLPFHTGSGVMAGVSANRLSISDPSLVFGDQLKLAWYAGSKLQRGLQGFISRVIDILALKTGNKYLIFFGVSGGGFASLEMSRRFPGSLAIPINPQTSITKYNKPAVDLYLEVAWELETPFHSATGKTIHDLTSSYSSTHTNTIAYIQNSRDSVHLREHKAPFFEKLTTSKNLWCLMDAWGTPPSTGHLPPSKYLIRKILAMTAESNGEWENALSELEFVKQ